jgi:hypothetical protein
LLADEEGQGEVGVYGWQKRSARGEGEILSSHTTSSANLQLYENSETKKQFEM